MTNFTLSRVKLNAIRNPTAGVVKPNALPILKPKFVANVNPPAGNLKSGVLRLSASAPHLLYTYPSGLKGQVPTAGQLVAAPAVKAHINAAYDADIIPPVTVHTQYDMDWAPVVREMFISARQEIKIDAYVNLLPAYETKKEGEYRLLVVDQGGNLVEELNEAQLGQVVINVADQDTFPFTISATDPKAQYCQPMENEVQLWRGQKLLFWGVIARAMNDSQTIQVQCLDLSHYFQRRVFGQVPQQNLLFKETQLDRARPAPVGSWDYTALPRSSPSAPPAHAPDYQTTYNEFGSLYLSSSTGKTTQTLSNDTIFNGTKLTSAGENAIWTILNDTHGSRPRISVNVYDDNNGDKAKSRKRAKARLESVTEYILSVIDQAVVIGAAPAYRHPEVRNDSPANRATNRRTEFQYRDNDGKKRHKQHATQKITLRNPSADDRPREVTLSGYVYVKNASGYAANFLGMQLVRASAKKAHPDPVWAKKGYKKPFFTATVPLGKKVPLRAWTRMEARVTLPADGKKTELEARLFVPNGDCFWSEVWLTKDDSMFYNDVEQADIVREIVTHAQDESIGKSDLGIGVVAEDTGVVRTRDYVFSDRGSIYEALAEFPTLANGMEWKIVCSPTERNLTTFYPRMGKDTNVVLANDSNVVSYAVASDGTMISTSVVVRMEHDTGYISERAAVDASLMDGTVLEVAYTGTPNSPASSWQAQANRGLARYRRPVIIPEVVIDPSRTSEILESVDVGDRLLVSIRDEWIETVQKYRVTQIAINPADDSLILSLYEEDLQLKALNKWESTGWDWFSQPQSPIVGANGKKPVESNPEYASRSFDSSPWPTAAAGFGWVKEATGTVVTDPLRLPKTNVPQGHEVWIRKTVQCTGDMIVKARVSGWAYLYVNGHLIRGQHFQGQNRHGKLGKVTVRVPSEFLHPSGDQVVAMHVQYDPARYNGDEMSSLYADVTVRGTYDPRLIV